MPDRLLYLCGGMPALSALPEFIAASGGEEARIAILAQSRVGWEQHPNARSEPFLTMLADGRARLVAPASRAAWTWAHILLRCAGKRERRSNMPIDLRMEAAKYDDLCYHMSRMAGVAN